MKETGDICRKNTHCVKWDSLTPRYGDRYIIPMGIADMDIPCLPEIQEAFEKRIRHNIYGYCFGYKEEILPLLAERCRRKGYDVQQEEIFLSTGVVYLMNRIILDFTKEGDGVVLLAPYYPPHRAIIEQNGREIVRTEMVAGDGRYVIDFDDLEKKVNERTKLFLLCHPQNPTGRIFDLDELKQISDFCERHGLLCISDEIHSDFNNGNRFIPAMQATEYLYNNTITVTSLTKTYNIAALDICFGFTKNRELFDKLNDGFWLSGLGSINVFGYEAALAILKHGEQWERETVQYIRENSEFAHRFIRERIPGLKFFPNEGTYVLWLDFRGYDLPENLEEYLIENAGVQLNQSQAYGWKGFARMNMACPRELLQEALERLEKCLNG